MKRVVKLASLLLIVLVNSSAVNYTKTLKKEVLENACKAKLQVKKERGIKSIVPNSNVIYHLILTNTSGSSASFNLKSKAIEGSCYKGTDRSLQQANYQDNISLSVKFIGITSTITLQPNESREITVQLSAPINTTINRWNCTEIKAISVDCNAVASSTVLKTFVIDPQVR